MGASRPERPSVPEEPAGWLIAQPSGRRGGVDASCESSQEDLHGGTYRLPGRPKLSRDELAPLGGPTFQGEHNRQVLGELGFDDEEIEGYISSGALVTAPLPTTMQAKAQ